MRVMTLLQWHTEVAGVFTWHEPGEIADIPTSEEERAAIAANLKAPLGTVMAVVSDLDALLAQGTVVETGDATLPVKPPEFPIIDAPSARKSKAAASAASTPVEEAKG